MTLFAFYFKHQLGLYVAAKTIGDAERMFNEKYPYNKYDRVERLGSVTVQPKQASSDD